jgi:hypothetical protein
VFLHNIMASGYRAPETDAPKDGSQLLVKAGDQEVKLDEGDGLFIENVTDGAQITLESTGGRPAEFLLFELSGGVEDEDDF